MCAANAYNITSIYHVLNRFAVEIGKQVTTERDPQCRLTTFLHSFVMDTFVERVRVDMEAKMEHAMISCVGEEGVWSALSLLPNHNVVRRSEKTLVEASAQAHPFQKVLSSAIRVLELARQIHTLISTTESYVQRFASLWLLILTGWRGQIDRVSA